MKSLFWTLMLVIIMVLAPVVAAGQAAQAAGANFPISQPLVREGTFATALAGAFKLGAVTDEPQAESLLSSAGITPNNGWIADYPVTPDIVGELEDSVAQASDSGGVKMSKDAALSAFQSVLDKYGLAVTEDIQTEPADVSSAPACSAGEDVNNYYNEEGPPVVTYCAPPASYDYLYSWVPYPFWWSDFWFPGFFVLVDFDRVVVVHHHRHHFSNHFFDAETGRMERVDAANRLHQVASSGGATVTSGAATTQRTQAVTKGMSAINASPTGSTSRISNTSTRFNAKAASNSAVHNNPVANSTGRTGSFSRPIESGKTASSWEGGHSFGGFRGFSGGRFGR